MKMTLNLDALAVESFDATQAGDPAPWIDGALVEAFSADVTQPHVCRTTTTTYIP